jgi:hypothetical protein
MTLRHRSGLVPAIAAGLLLLAAPARADLVSPGELSRPHEKLEGLSNCTRCHAAGQKLSPEKCLECHKELRPEIAEGRGFHGRLRDRSCENCHHEHQGRGFALLDWGDGGQARFDHGRTGWALAGKHARVKCQDCHDPRRVTDADVKEVLGKGRKSMLGAPTTCAGCHFDEHRGQLGKDCQKCHDATAWKPAKGFDHAKAAYTLQGAHAKVSCEKCHPRQADPQGKGGFPAAVAPTYLKLKPVPFQACTDCHKDPHQGRFGPGCATCHAVEGWRAVKPQGESATFHDKTRYPLRGQHATVACKACHGPFPGAKKAVYKPLSFQACVDCHADAHLGQMGARGTPAAACDRCHAVQAWIPVRFTLEDHQKTKYPLEGAHRAVACGACHPRNPKVAERIPAPIRAEAQLRGRPLKVSEFTVDRKPDTARCTTCHRDVHQGQFSQRMAQQGCTACHEVASWSRTRFDHARDTKFPLEGKHARTPCASCHVTAAGKDGQKVVKYAGAPMACARCHADPHAGQLAVKGVTDCGRCHGVEEYKKTKFAHAPPFTDYALVGKHATVACEKCHPMAKVGTLEIRRYKPLPRECQACHVDFHKGAFRGYEP